MYDTLQCKKIPLKIYGCMPLPLSNHPPNVGIVFLRNTVYKHAKQDRNITCLAQLNEDKYLVPVFLF